jgi:hypothetical protein
LLGIGLAAALLVSMACGSSDSAGEPTSITLPGLTITPGPEPTLDAGPLATLEASQGGGRTSGPLNEVTPDPTLRPTPRPVITVLTPTPGPTFIIRPTIIGATPEGGTPGPGRLDPTPTPKPTATPAPTSTLQPGFRLEINGAQVEQGQLEIAVEFGTVRLLQSPGEDNRHTDGRTVHLEVDFKYADSDVIWAGIDTATGGNASVFMLTNKFVRVLIVPPPGAVPTPTPTYEGETQLAFQSNLGTDWQIYVMRIDGIFQNLLSSEAGDARAPSWSPNGEQILFDTGRSGNQEIFVVDADGTNPKNLTRNASADLWPEWSSDSKKIAFTSQRSGNSDIWVMNADRTEPIQLTDDPKENISPTWSPDGNKIACASLRDGYYEIYSMSADGTGQTRLTTIPEDKTGNALEPSWSPDGKKIAFT